MGIASSRFTGSVLKPEDFSGGEGSKCFRILRDLGFDVVSKPEFTVTDGNDWSAEELDAAVDAYIRMLRSELTGLPYSKAETNKALRDGPLANRSKGAVEYRMGNISSVLHLMGRRWIVGYKPAANVGTNVHQSIQASLARLDAAAVDDLVPEADPAALNRKVKRTRNLPPVNEPVGSETPGRSTRSVESYERDPHVIAWVLERANGICELCGSPAPFVDSDGVPFLEVHHVLPLAEGGADTTENAVAVCPNCHRRCHHSEDRMQVRDQLFARRTQLKRPTEVRGSRASYTRFADSVSPIKQR